MKSLKVALKVSAVILAFPTIFSCSKTDEARNVLPSGGPYPTILVAQAQFLYEKKDGKKLPKPGPAILTLKQKTPKGLTKRVKVI